MAIQNHAGVSGAVPHTVYFALGSGLYLVYSPQANRFLNTRYRRQMLADTLATLAALMHAQAEQFVLASSGDVRQPNPLLGELLRQHSALTERLQNARNILLESTDTPEQQRLAAMLLLVMEMRDHLMACELDVQAVRELPRNYEVMQSIYAVFQAVASDVDQLADAVLQRRAIEPIVDRRAQLSGLPWSTATDEAQARATLLAQALASRVGHLQEDAVRLAALAGATLPPDLELIKTYWHMFVSPSAWSARPFFALWRWSAPPLRHALRAALAIGFAYALTLYLPWGAHDYWILLTIVVVLRGSLAQTLERRNSRVAGTLLGCLLAGLLIYLHPSALVILLVLTLAQAVAHGLALRRYLVTAIAATVLGLVQAHLLKTGVSPVFDVLERIGDTLIGAAIAWGFSYVVPSWEKHQIAQLLQRSLTAQSRYAAESLQLAPGGTPSRAPELPWRLARRDCYESLSALVQATQRALAEPRAVQPPLLVLEVALAHSYQLLGQLTAIKTMLWMRRERLQLDQVQAPLAQAAQRIHALLTRAASDPGTPLPDAPQWRDSMPLSDPFTGDLTPWMLRRLDLATQLAEQLARQAHALARQSSELAA